MGLSLVLAVALSAAPTPKQEAATHYQRGIALYKESNYSAALSEFKAAYAALPSWEVLFNIGLCQRRLFQYGQAIQSFSRYLAEGGAKVPKDRRAAVDQELQQIRALTAPIAVIVKGAPAKVLVDGEEVGKTPLTEMVLLGPGKHLIRAEREGCSPDEKAIEVVSGQAQAVELDPRSLTAPGKVSIECSPPTAMVAVDQGSELACPLQVDLPPGTHELVARADGHALLRTEVIVQPGEPRAVKLSLVPMAAPSKPFPVLGVSLLAGGVVAGGVGAVFALLARSASNEVSELSTMGGTWDLQAAATESAGKRDTIIAWSLIGVGSALVATGIVLIALNPGASTEVALVPGPTGVFACGTF
ncbi:MAG: PEGA domain-containing protein [Myxococcota bacterium]